MFKPLVLLVHPDAISREILVHHLVELRWIAASSSREVPGTFDEPPSLLLGDADHVSDLDAVCVSVRITVPALRSVALAGERRAAELPNIDTVLVKPVALDRLRMALLREAMLWARGSGSRPITGGEPQIPVLDSDYDPDDVATRRVRY